MRWYTQTEKAVLPCTVECAEMIKFNFSSLLPFCKQNEVYQNATDCVEIKKKTCFQLHCTCSDKLFAAMLPFAVSNFPFLPSVMYFKLGALLRLL
jgi:hypothetical protein